MGLVRYAFTNYGEPFPDALGDWAKWDEVESLFEQLGNGYICAHGHRWHMGDQPKQCPGCGTITFEASQ